MLFVLTGNGKGKTTGALGTALRAAGWGFKTGIVFFDKGGAHYGEQSMLDGHRDKIDVFRFGLPRFDEKNRTFRFENVPGDFTQAKAGLKKVAELFSQDYFLIICDELLNALRLGLVDELSVRELCDCRPAQTHLLLTGLELPEWLAKKADLISEVQEVKHYFRKGQDAIKGIDF